jgi:hypothetical protein
MLLQNAPSIVIGRYPVGAPSHPYPHEYTNVPSGWLRWDAEATRLKVGPVIPGLAAKAAGVIIWIAAITARSKCIIEIFFMFFGLMAALLVALVAKCGSRH